MNNENDKNEKVIETNVGKIPYEEYLEIQVLKYGFDSYEDLIINGYILSI